MKPTSTTALQISGLILLACWDQRSSRQPFTVFIGALVAMIFTELVSVHQYVDMLYICVANQTRRGRI
jgi:hypothetical protein